jgi:hypothetical protein
MLDLTCPLDRWRDADLDRTWLFISTYELSRSVYDRHVSAGLDPFAAARADVDQRRR